ncbi:hypothetical protein K435DRAFT_927492 [Dendrothele bispora CBS 962.96]|uniref:Xylanolytic transcriptional activator regulatory domain-containing protein n=1 Tax=Dendrothele bispora (strain CBS 962.96) TaxID=1314807 RepID=A0A4S8L7J2_DENBC|nr:hypothetical protein K435DRAFT_927492 [Dendrothele bispora CBS 962.96]
MSAIVNKIVQERRAHRHATLDARLDPGSKMEAELWKRMLWTLLMIDMKVSMIFGSPRGIPTYGFDLEHLIKYDDEYWEHDDPSQAFIQPPGKPSSIAYWNHYVKLVKITTFAHDVLFSEHDWQPWKRMGISSHTWKQKAVIEIDSDLNKWVESIPDHLRWDPHTQNEIFLAQSSVLYTTYYWLQIQIHRRFIPRPGQKPLLSFPSLAICSNAARACVHIAESCLKRIFITHPHFLIPLSSSAIVLAVNIWRGKRVDSNFNPQNDLLDIHRCITLLRLYESRYEAVLK